ncbi:type II 3-dehydroquinate dehydratase [Lachnoanaerobaculum umeaense]|jgi:3-dehydroquinate dehydratase, type II|uniref:3-dehydroquinate dehydratase n=1 Tax=Lachnoanaerobaculum umeaense TaxID=617123 RepID=A0A385PYV7_9FIRM|nr:type II 3-dehydroquinate dehydratase [Lachnoanaerobaculum umeaense]AYA99290.1 type II 3-dehydroquinate dehydratase [Lachnoanaerobaculum umeaense]PZW94312.1 3-dehydroquinate dehydratase [Lachnoanaerobaculum umeaense]
MKILVINGVNMNFLGIRNKEVYGNKGYNYLLEMIENKAKELGVEVECFQSNHEGYIVDKLQEAYFEKPVGIVINPAAFTHTSVAIRDALESLECIKVEVHISNISDREEFRHKSLTQPVCTGQIAGLGLHGYTLAMEYIIEQTKS